MKKLFVLPGLAIFGAALPVSASVQTEPDQSVNPRAIELFERDQRLMRWALRRFDVDEDGLISPAEAHAGALAFKQIADGDGDGRVTPYEFDRAREFIIARF